MFHSAACIDTTYVVIAALCNRTGHYIFALWFLSVFCPFFLA